MSALGTNIRCAAHHADASTVLGNRMALGSTALVYFPLYPAWTFIVRRTRVGHERRYQRPREHGLPQLRCQE